MRSQEAVRSQNWCVFNVWSKLGHFNQRGGGGRKRVEVEEEGTDNSSFSVHSFLSTEEFRYISHQAFLSEGRKAEHPSDITDTSTEEEEDEENEEDEDDQTVLCYINVPVDRRTFLQIEAGNISWGENKNQLTLHYWTDSFYPLLHFSTQPDATSPIPSPPTPTRSGLSRGILGNVGNHWLRQNCCLKCSVWFLKHLLLPNNNSPLCYFLFSVLTNTQTHNTLNVSSLEDGTWISHNYLTRGSSTNLILLRFKTFGKNTFLYSAATHWDNFPSRLKLFTSSKRPWKDG